MNELQELKEIFNLLKKRVHFLIIFTIVGAVAAFFYNSFQTTKYTASILIFLKPPAVSSETATAEYFSQLKSADFTDTAVGLLTSDEIQKQFLVAIEVEKIAPQLIKLTASDIQQDLASKSAILAVETANKTLEKFFPQNKTPTLEVLLETPTVSEKQPNFLLNLLVGAFVGFVFGLLIIAFLIYLRPQKDY